MDNVNQKLIEDMSKGIEVAWINPCKENIGTDFTLEGLGVSDIIDAEKRLERFAPFLMKCFPETAISNGIIESELTEIASMKDLLNEKHDSKLEGRLFIKRDSELPIAGSIKARGGIYEVLKYTEELATKNGLIEPGDDYTKLISDDSKEFFGKYKIQVGSTGNLGLSIGIMSAAIGYETIVHMSMDAKQWKKELLRANGVTVKEYETDYSKAVENGRKLSDMDPMSYFVDDENSKNLFVGYAVAAKRLKKQLDSMHIKVDSDNPLFVYIPCGIGGAPGGVTFGLKEIYGDNVHVFFVEPVQAPCMLLGMATGLNSKIAVQDIGLTGKTEPDGLAVGRASGFVGDVMKPLLSGEFTIADEKLYVYMKELFETEGIFIEPSSCAIFEGTVKLMNDSAMREYIVGSGLSDKMANASHIVWATGGRLVPESVRKEYFERA